MNVIKSTLVVTAIAGFTIIDEATTGHIVHTVNTYSTAMKNNDVKSFASILLRKTLKHSVLSNTSEKEPYKTKTTTSLKNIFALKDATKIHIKCGENKTVSSTNSIEMSQSEGTSIMSTLDMTDNTMYIWSSYRYINHDLQPCENHIYIFKSMRDIYGKQHSLYRCKDLHDLIPM